MCLGGKATKEDGDAVQALFAAVGKIFTVEPSPSEYSRVCPGSRRLFTVSSSMYDTESFTFNSR